MSDRPTPETDEAWDAVSRLPSGMYDSRVSIWAYATAMSDHSRKMERQRDELLEALESFLGRARIGEVNKGMFVRIEELEGLSAAIAAVKATGKEIA